MKTLPKAFLGALLLCTMLISPVGFAESIPVNLNGAHMIFQVQNYPAKNPKAKGQIYSATFAENTFKANDHITGKFPQNGEYQYTILDKDNGIAKIELQNQHLPRNNENYTLVLVFDKDGESGDYIYKLLGTTTIINSGHFVVRAQSTKK